MELIGKSTGLSPVTVSLKGDACLPQERFGVPGCWSEKKGLMIGESIKMPI
ncbi:hypothetical protein J7431_08040 [Xanthomonas phaseoli pv. dieffenbachiae]|uniref:hypothetical protein n=1 Tax=Xanthomonas TaxID=338 RepID=UPI001593FB95|nr:MULTISPECIES: hypothetical protein [Xanthomonas]MBO9747217.1 hypothetical protein [Xanthomonas phaseoli pv. dieffenbachiae]MBO9749826.1 hypothetical protein [Xanthomonas phaseoli pv. dieffenbachiae]MBO9890279.1 hypothetical protein [Xanthomonas sp. D-36-1]